MFISKDPKSEVLSYVLDIQKLNGANFLDLELIWSCRPRYLWLQRPPSWSFEKTRRRRMNIPHFTILLLMYNNHNKIKQINAGIMLMRFHQMKHDLYCICAWLCSVTYSKHVTTNQSMLTRVQFFRCWNSSGKRSQQNEVNAGTKICVISFRISVDICCIQSAVRTQLGHDIR